MTAPSINLKSTLKTTLSELLCIVKTTRSQTHCLYPICFFSWSINIFAFQLLLFPWTLLTSFNYIFSLDSIYFAQKNWFSVKKKMCAVSQTSNNFKQVYNCLCFWLFSFIFTLYVLRKKGVQLNYTMVHVCLCWVCYLIIPATRWY
jgi:hypothetical protein